MNDKLTLNDFYQELPDEITKNADRLNLDLNAKKNIINQMIPEINKEKCNDYNKSKTKYKALCIDDIKVNKKISKESRKKNFNKKKLKENKITAKQRHNLFSLKKVQTFKYKTFLEINLLWKSYMQDVLKQCFKEVKTDNESNLNLFNFLVKADYHGALMIVSESKNPLLVGIKGIVVKENKKVFYIINDQNKVLVVPKIGTIFAFEINQRIFKLNGSYIQINSFQRTRAKFKSIKSFMDF